MTTDLDRLIARASEHRIIIQRRAGPMLSAGDVATRLSISRRVVYMRRAVGRLLAVQVGRVWRFPEFQFDGASVLAGFEDLLVAHGHDDAWAILDSLTATDAVLAGRSVVEALRAGDVDGVETVRQLAGDGFS